MYFTEKQLRIMKFIQRFRSARGISPTMEEIAGEVGVTKITIHDHLKQLERKGALRREKFRARSIEPLVWVGEPGDQMVLPLLGPFRVGEPLDGRKVEGTLDLKTLFPINDNCFAFQVQGDFLQDSHIRDRDYVIVQRRDEASNGDLVVAQLSGGQATIQRFFKERSRVRLQPPNPKKKSSIARARDVLILGVVVGLLRGFGDGAQS